MHSIKKVTMLLGGLALTCSIAFQASATEKFKGHYNIYHHRGYGQNVAGDAAEVSSITKPGAEIHEYQPTPGDIKRARGTTDSRQWYESGIVVPTLLPASQWGSRSNCLFGCDACRDHRRTL